MCIVQNENENEKNEKNEENEKKPKKRERDFRVERVDHLILSVCPAVEYEYVSCLRYVSLKTTCQNDPHTTVLSYHPYSIISWNNKKAPITLTISHHR